MNFEYQDLMNEEYRNLMNINDMLNPEPSGNPGYNGDTPQNNPQNNPQNQPQNNENISSNNEDIPPSDHTTSATQQDSLTEKCYRQLEHNNRGRRVIQHTLFSEN